MERAWIGLGGNEGSVDRTLTSALGALRGLSLGPLLSSPIYETDPWGEAASGLFLNQVVGLVPDRAPRALLRALLRVERAHGRRRTGARNGPRTLDLDLLSWTGRRVSAPGLEVPHPRLHLRRFVLVPWAEIAPDERVPGHDATVAELLARCPDSATPRRWSAC